MAGTLTVGVRPLHIYQRRFDSEALAEALKGCHLYIISRRPRVQLNEESLVCRSYGVRIRASSRREGESSTWEQTIKIAPVDREPLSEFQVHASGGYFSMRVGRRLIHGDAWALASLYANAAEAVAGQEVMYIGKAFGADGSSNVWTRIQNHKKLQMIYEDHLQDGWDVFVTALEVEYMKMSSDDHIDDADDGPDLFGGYYGRYVDLETNQVLKSTIDLAEHGLIAHFAPHYNEQLLEWRASDPTDDMKLMRSGGFRLLQIHVNGWWGSRAILLGDSALTRPQPFYFT